MNIAGENYNCVLLLALLLSLSSCKEKEKPLLLYFDDKDTATYYVPQTFFNEKAYREKVYEKYKYLDEERYTIGEAYFIHKKGMAKKLVSPKELEKYRIVKGLKDWHVYIADLSNPDSLFIMETEQRVVEY
ncbi:hypothetical protein ACQ1R0_03475 [Ornithobacterium rhinotracheale]|uniref:hypothetical protein n=1 Tax=Ornithobacterium rhinotracheale TaxID=28251 RepID=UPI004035D210